MIALLDKVALAGTWCWILRRRITFNGIRQKLAVADLILASISVILDLVLTLVMHFHNNSDDTLTAKAFIVESVLGTLSAHCPIFARV